MNKLKRLSPTILRIGLALVFLWFGTSQIMKPSDWVGFIPDWVAGASTLSATIIVYLNGTLEIILGAALLLGLFTRIVSLLLFLHLIGIMYTVGFDALGVRDFGLTVAMLCIFLNGHDVLTLDRFMRKGAPASMKDTEISPGPAPVSNSSALPADTAPKA